MRDELKTRYPDAKPAPDAAPPTTSTLLPDYRTTALPHYRTTTLLPHYRTTVLPHYLTHHLGVPA